MALDDTVPSSAADVLKRNAADFDKLIDNTSGTVTSRTGKELLPWQVGLRRYLSFNNRGAWTTATAYQVNDIWESAGTWYLVLTSYTSGATAEDDISSGFVQVLQNVPVGTAAYAGLATDEEAIAGSAGVIPDADQVRKNHVATVTTIADLRSLEPAFDGQQVSLNQEGSAGIFYFDESSSLADDGSDIFVTPGGKRWLRATRVSLDSIDGEIVSKNNTDVALIDLHFLTSRGTGWIENESVSPSWATTTVVSASGNTVDVANVALFVVGQLIGIESVNGQYYSYVVRGISSSTLTLDADLTVSVSAGSTIGPFYRDDAHPNYTGSFVVIDDALRQLKKRLAKTEYFSRIGGWVLGSGSTITYPTQSNYLTVGAAVATKRAATVTFSGLNSYVFSEPAILAGGDYRVSFPINTGKAAAGPANIAIYIDSTSGAGTAAIATTTLVGTDHTTLVELDFSVPPESSVSIRVINMISSENTISVGFIRYDRIQSNLRDINRGKHVLLGDSWFTSGGELHSAIIDRLNSAEVISKGVPGNRADQLVARFQTDVTPENPDYVWVMCGTNDYYQGVSDGQFQAEIVRLREMIYSIGAQPIFFTPSVGSAYFIPEQITPSRNLTISTQYLASAPSVQQFRSEMHTIPISVQNVSVPGLGYGGIYVTPYQTRDAVEIDSVYINDTLLRVSVSYCSNPDGSGSSDEVVIPSGYGYAKIAKPSSGYKFVCFKIYNPTGTEQTSASAVAVLTMRSIPERS